MTPISQLAHPTADVFLLGFIVAAAFAVLLFFLRFWKSTRDPLFMAFAVFFGAECVNHTVVLTFSHPNEGSFLFFLIRLLSTLGILAAILWKNLKTN
ncbi:MAG TPA: DUF5985 family protein [Terracidiphilus sp.]|nr:DUF5985 family protein [Terracidiphilus sp.]